MIGKELHRFFLSIVFPSILAVGLYILSIFIVILPSFEKNIMDKKKEMISELTHTVWSLLEDYNQDYINQNIPIEEVQKKAALKVRQIRYGEENKDYFWIIDHQPSMIMHPYRPELINTDLSNYKDPNGKQLFLEASTLTAQKGEGFIDYMWQWKDDSTKIVQKLSYVKAFEPWSWIIGTGIYIEDEKEEIKILKNRLLKISFLIILIISAILTYIIQQSLKIENKRQNAEFKLLLSKQKYKSLVDASTEGTLMIINNRIIFSNIKFSKLSVYDISELLTLKFENIFNTKWDKLISSFDDPKKSISLETQVICGNGTKKEVVLLLSEIEYDNTKAYILITKELSPQRLIEKETENLSQELQHSLLLMSQSIKSHISDVVKCSFDASIHDGVLQMTSRNSNILFIYKNNEIIGTVNSNDLKNRVLAKDLNLKKSIAEIMSSPIIKISENALLFEVILQLKNKDISHLATVSDDGKISGVIGYEAIYEIQQNSISYLLKEIEISEDIEQLIKIHSKVPIIVNALLESGNKTQNIERFISVVSDLLLHRIISMTIDNIGEPPCEFAFVVLGSEGRMEQSLCTDQDNAIVFEDQKAEKIDIAHNYFHKLGEEVNYNLNELGYIYCGGNIMAKNSKWTQALSVWKKYFSEWIHTSDPQSIMEASIFLDFRCVYGNESIIHNLRKHVNTIMDNKSAFSFHLAESIISYKTPLNLFGNIISNDHSEDHVFLDIKKILFPIIGFVRLFALKHMLHETNTLSRINQLKKDHIINTSIYNELVFSYNYLMHLRFRFQSFSVKQNKVPDNLVDIGALTNIEIATIKKIFTIISDLQSKLKLDYRAGT